MAPVARDTNGRRLYAAEFKRQQAGRIERGEVGASELSRELGIARSLIQRWKHSITRARETSVGANEEVVPVSALRTAEQRIRELERAVGRKTMEVEVLPAARDEVKKPRGYGASTPRPGARWARSAARSASAARPCTAPWTRYMP